MTTTEIEMSDWQTIESAPKDGAAVLVYTNGGQVTEAYWSSDNQSWILRFYDEDNRFLRAKGGMEIFHISPTHWMPLPPPPKK